MKWGMPYMGNKSDIASSLSMMFPKAENFYDLFGGGGAMTHYLAANKAHKYKNFHYNEIVPSTADLFKRAINGEFSCDNFKPEWISREDFFARKDNDAYVRICWSFGNNQKDYLFGEDIESYKKSMHMAVVFNEFDDVAARVFGFKKWPEKYNTIKLRRSFLAECVRKSGGKKQLQQLDRLQQLQRLERLQRLEQLEELGNISITALDYRDVQIKPNAVVYCDIPYENTGKYIMPFNKKAFLDWAATRDFPVFISEYKIEDERFKIVYSVEKTVKLSPKGTSKQLDGLEKLYWNGKTI
jgi:site-specific DNA-adenine methylase